MLDLDRTLRKISANLMFEWNSNVHLLFRAISPYVWGLFRRNLFRFLKLQEENPALYQRRLAEILTESSFLRLVQTVEEDYRNYMEPETTIVRQKYPDLQNKTVAYFSMEYGIDILRIYSGGLGILSGDHLRGASDLGIRMVGVGLFYLQGYYEQAVGLDGKMKVSYDPVVPPRKNVRDFLPLEPVKRIRTTDDLIVDVFVNNRTIKAKVWRARIGRCELFLLDTDLRDNHVHDRHITRRLYASEKHHDKERRRRLEQELLLGIGGVKALIGAGHDPYAYHLNEGHAAFSILEVIRGLMTQSQHTFEEASKMAADIVGFTTHTPVPEGNERFDEHMVREYLHSYLDQFLQPQAREVIFNCARNRENLFDMTKMALMMSGVHRNGVSKLHGEVCRKMWGYAWGFHDSEGKQTPIGSITNSVHVPYWQKPALRNLIQEKGGLKAVSAIDDADIWQLHLEFKQKFIEKTRERVAYQLVREDRDSQEIHFISRDLLDVDSFMIGFARRFAGYKRVTMLLEDENRLFQFLENAYRRYNKPVHILFAGKPHPNNHQAYERIAYIMEMSEKLQHRCRERNFRAQLLFIENYDIDLARYLEAGVDVWLNNPIRPQEASGTSGMKAGMNGVLNVSIADGWVPEGIQDGVNGWLFGRGEAQHTDSDRTELFELLENKILPLYFEQTGKVSYAGVEYTFSKKWVRMMKASIEGITGYFNTDRMLSEYVEKMYLPAVHNRLKQQTAVHPAS